MVLLETATKAAPSLMQALPKRNTRPPPPAFAERPLFDRDCQSPDQPRDFVQLSGVMVLNRPDEPGQAFIVAHRRLIVWDDRQDRTIGAIGMKNWHQIISRIEPAKPAWFRIKTFCRPVRDADGPCAAPSVALFGT
jgi:hypothetical protein